MLRWLSHPLTLTLSPKGRGKKRLIYLPQKERHLPVGEGNSHCLYSLAASSPAFHGVSSSLTSTECLPPSPLWGEGWGEGIQNRFTTTPK